MSTLPFQDSTADCVRDYDCLVEGVEYFLKLQQRVVTDGSTSHIAQHYKQHPEDILCNIYRPDNLRTVLCRRSGIDSISRIAQRLVSEASNNVDLSVQAIAKTISQNIYQVMIDGVTDDDELVAILRSYVALTESEHRITKYHFPCVIVAPKPKTSGTESLDADGFVFHPVKFQSLPQFLASRSEYSTVEVPFFDEDSLKYFTSNSEKHGWVASIEIPTCHPDTSIKRAEDIIEAAINLLKVFIGLGYANAMRLPHISAFRDRETCILQEFDRRATCTWHGRRLEGALVLKGWFFEIPLVLRNLASFLLDSCLNGRRSESANRLVDALKWFGDAAYEISSGVQIAKWITALERLTTTEHFKTHVFCVRVAILTTLSGDDASLEMTLETAYKEARKAYVLRCDVMHGSRSQDDFELATQVAFVHNLTRTAIENALIVHNRLSVTTQDARLHDIASFYETAALRFKPLFDRLNPSETKPKQPKKPKRR